MTKIIVLSALDVPNQQNSLILRKFQLIQENISDEADIIRYNNNRKRAQN